jgi:hypothetical protein
LRDIPAPLAAHIQETVTTLAVCWRITRRDDVLILGTEHDQDITIAAGDYAGTYRARAGITGSDVRSTSDMSVDNMEVQGAIREPDLITPDLSAADIEAGLFDDASVVLFQVNWQAPDDGQIVLRTGNAGEITRTAEGMYRAEVRGLAQRLTQNIIRTYGSSCDAELGDARCKVDLAAITVTGEVTAVTSARRFVAELDVGSPAETLDIELFLPMPRDITVGDTFTIRPGCDKAEVTCRETFNNLENFRGHGYLVPGIGELTAFGGQTAEKKPKVAGVKRFGLFASTLDKFIPKLEELLPGVPAEVGELFYNGGLVTWSTGDNAGYAMEVKSTTAVAP